MKSILRISNLRALSAMVAVILALPVSWHGLSGFYLWLSPYIMLNSVLSLKSFVWLNVFGILVLILVFFRKRWFCNHLCPVGWSCDKVSGFSRRKSVTYSRLPEIGKWMAVISVTASLIGFPLFVMFDPLAIFNGFFSIFSAGLKPVAIVSASVLPLLLFIHLFLPGIWCNKLCPLGGLQLAADDVKNLSLRIFSHTTPADPASRSGRRYFLMSGIGLIGGAAIPLFLKPAEKAIIRPPAAVEPVLFKLLCCRCGNCTRACPTDIILPVTDPSYPLSWMTPSLSFKTGYCLETCNLCSQVCPTGAITLFSVEAKGRLFIGTAAIEPENCLLVNNKECIRCKESCKYDAIEFLASGNILNMIPVADAKKCVGCGACAVICPVACIKIIQD